MSDGEILPWLECRAVVQYPLNNKQSAVTAFRLELPAGAKITSAVVHHITARGEIAVNAQVVSVKPIEREASELDALRDRVKALEAVAAAARVVIDSADALDFDWRYGALADDGGQEAVSAAALLALERRVKR